MTLKQYKDHLVNKQASEDKDADVKMITRFCLKDSVELFQALCCGSLKLEQAKAIILKHCEAIITDHESKAISLRPRFDLNKAVELHQDGLAQISKLRKEADSTEALQNALKEYQGLTTEG